MTSLYEKSIVFFIGAMGYAILETAFRGYTHWTMLLAGGICFTILYIVNKRYFHLNLWIKCLIGTIVITSVEFVIGCIANIWLGWNVWDYSNFHLNIWGQICLPFSILWYFMSIPIYILCNYILREFNKFNMV